MLAHILLLSDIETTKYMARISFNFFETYNIMWAYLLYLDLKPELNKTMFWFVLNLTLGFHTR